eukprot:8924282-Lingulodinium_polyedra.AAC.1
MAKSTAEEKQYSVNRRVGGGPPPAGPACFWARVEATMWALGSPSCSTTAPRRGHCWQHHWETN